MKKLAVKFEVNEILGAGDFDTFACYRASWKTDSEKQNSVRQGIVHSGSCSDNCMKLQINAKDKDATYKRDKVIADTYKTSSLFLFTLKC